MVLGRTVLNRIRLSDCSFLTKENRSYFLEEVFDILLVSRFEDVLISKTKSYDELRFAFKDAAASSELFSCVHSISGIANLK